MVSLISEYRAHANFTPRRNLNGAPEIVARSITDMNIHNRLLIWLGWSRLPPSKLPGFLLPLLQEGVLSQWRCRLKSGVFRQTCC